MGDDERSSARKAGSRVRVAEVRSSGDVSSRDKDRDEERSSRREDGPERRSSSRSGKNLDLRVSTGASRGSEVRTSSTQSKDRSDERDSGGMKKSTSAGALSRMALSNSSGGQAKDRLARINAKTESSTSKTFMRPDSGERGMRSSSTDNFNRDAVSKSSGSGSSVKLVDSRDRDKDRDRDEHRDHKEKRMSSYSRSPSTDNLARDSVKNDKKEREKDHKDKDKDRDRFSSHSRSPSTDNLARDSVSKSSSRIDRDRGDRDHKDKERERSGSTDRDRDKRLERIPSRDRDSAINLRDSARDIRDKEVSKERDKTDREREREAFYRDRERDRSDSHRDIKDSGSREGSKEQAEVKDTKDGSKDGKDGKDGKDESKEAGGSSPQAARKEPSSPTLVSEAISDPELVEWLKDSTGQVARLGTQIRDLYKRQSAAESAGDRELATFYKKQIEGLKRQVAICLGKSAPPPPMRIPSPERKIEEKPIAHTPPTPQAIPDKPEKETKADRKARASMALLDLEAMWASKTRVVVPWSNPGIEDKYNPSVIDAAPGYQIEAAHDSVAKFEHPVQLEEEQRAMAFYCSQLKDKPHKHYVGDSEESGPVIMSAEETDNPKARVVVRLKRGDVRVALPKKDIKKAVVEVLPELASVKLEKLSDGAAPALTEALADYETKLVEKRHKFGVLFIREGQGNEDLWYQNQERTPDFEQFLDILGTRIELKGWAKFAGGLNTREGHTGSHSVYTCFRDIEVMFHVAPLLPHFPDDHQQIEKKRHLGNDVCLIIFREEGCKAPFSPLQIRSQFNHVFIVVQADRSSGSLKYRVVCTNKPGVSRYGPPIPVPGLFDPVADKELLHEFFIAKPMHAPDFKGKNTATRKTYLTRLLQSHDPRLAKKT